MKKLIIGTIVGISLLTGFVANAEAKSNQAVSNYNLDDGILKKSKEYVIVKRGDSLWAYSQKYMTSIESIKRVNGLKSDMIKIGQKIWIPYYHDVVGKHVNSTNDNNVTFSVLEKKINFYCPYGEALKFNQSNMKGKRYILTYHKEGNAFVLDTAEPLNH